MCSGQSGSIVSSDRVSATITMRHVLLLASVLSVTILTGSHARPQSATSFMGGRGEKQGTVQERAVHEGTDLERAVQESTNQKRAVQESTNQKRAVQESTNQKRAVQESTNQKRAVPHSTIQKRAVQESTNQKRAVQESTNLKRAVQESTVQKRAVKESTVQKRQAVCDNDASVLLAACVSPMGLDDAYDALDHLDVDNPDALDQLCQRQQTAKSCVAGVLHACGHGDVMTQIDVEEKLGVVGYICSKEGKSILYAERECWEKDEDIGAIITACAESDQYQTGNVCNDATGVRKCIKRGVRAICNRRSAKFLGNIFYYGIEPLTRHLFDCELRQRLSRSLLKDLPQRLKRGTMPKQN